MTEYRDMIRNAFAFKRTWNPPIIPVSDSHLKNIQMETYADSVFRTIVNSIAPVSEEEKEQTIYAEDKIIKLVRDVAFLKSFLPNDLRCPTLKPFSALEFVTEIRDIDLRNNGTQSDYPHLYLMMDQLKEEAVTCKVTRYLRKQKMLSVAVLHYERTEDDLKLKQHTVAVASSLIVFLFTLQLADTVCIGFLKEMLADGNVLKVVHNAVSFEEELEALLDVQLQCFVDVALVQKDIVKSRSPEKSLHTIQDLIRFYSNYSSDFKQLVRQNFPPLRVYDGSSRLISNENRVNLLEQVIFLQSIQKYQLSLMMDNSVAQTETVVQEGYVVREETWPELPEEETFVQSIPQRTSPQRVESSATLSTSSAESEKECDDEYEETHYSCGTEITVG